MGNRVLFRVGEYNEAFRTAFQQLLHANAEDAFPLLKQIPTEPRPAIHTTQVTLPSGATIKSEPLETKIPFRFNLVDMVNGDIEAFTASAAASGRAYGEAAMEHLLNYSGAISEAMGNVIEVAGRAFGWPIILEALERIDIDFNENGEPQLPQMVSHEDVRRVVTYPLLDDVTRPAYDALIERKRKEFNARQRRRTLS